MVYRINDVKNYICKKIPWMPLMLLTDENTSGNTKVIGLEDKMLSIDDLDRRDGI